LPNAAIEKIVLSARERTYEIAEAELVEQMRLLGLTRSDIADVLKRLEDTEARFGPAGRLALLRDTTQSIQRLSGMYLALGAGLAASIQTSLSEGYLQGEQVALEIAAHLGERLIPAESMLSALQSQVIPFADNATRALEARIRGELVRGVYAGETIPALTQRLIGAGLDSRGTPWKSASARAEATIRTEASRGFHSAMRTNLDPQPWITGYMWQCYFSGEWPCYICRPLCGRFFPKEQLISSAGNAVRHPPIHPNCLCVLLPVTKQYGLHTID